MRRRVTRLLAAPVAAGLLVGGFAVARPERPPAIRPQLAADATTATPTPAKTMAFTGTLTDNVTGAPLSGLYDIEFAVFDAATSGAEQWTELQTSVTVDQGRFNTLLGRTTAFPDGLFDLTGSVQRHLEVRVGAVGLPRQPLSPRIEIARVGAAFFADRSADLACAAGPCVSGAELQEQAVGTANVALGAISTDRVADAAITSAKLADATVNTADIAAGAITSSLIGGAQVASGHLQDGAVTSAKLASGSVTSTVIAANAIVSGLIADGSVATADIADAAIDGTKLAGGAVSTGHIAADAIVSGAITDGQVLTSDLGDAAVTSAKLATGAVDTAHVAADAIVSSLIANGEVLAEDIGTGAVRTIHLADGAVDEAKIASGAVVSTLIADGQVATVDLANSAVTSAKLAGGAVTQAHIAADAIVSSLIADGQVATVDLADAAVNSLKLAAGAVDTAHVAVDAIVSDRIEDGQVLTQDLANAAVDGTKLAAGAVTTTHVALNAIVSDRIEDGQVFTHDLANAAVDGTKLATGAVDTLHVATDAIVSDRIADGEVLGADIGTKVVNTIHLADGAVGEAQIAAAQIIGAHIKDGQISYGHLTSDAVSAFRSALDPITGTDIAASTITSDLIAADAIITGLIADGAVTTDAIANGSITPQKLAAETIDHLRSKLTARPTYGDIDVGVAAVSTAVTIGSDGLPFIAYSNGTDISVIHCEDPGCTTRSTPAVLTTLTSSDPSIAVGIGASGNPIVAWSDGVVRCADPRCASPVTVENFPWSSPVGAVQRVLVDRAGDVLVVGTGGVQCLGSCHISYPTGESFAIGGDGLGRAASYVGGNALVIETEGGAYHYHEVAAGGPPLATIGPDGLPLIFINGWHEEPYNDVYNPDDPVCDPSHPDYAYYSTTSLCDESIPTGYHVTQGPAAVHCLDMHCEAIEMSFIDLPGVPRAWAMGPDGFPVLLVPGPDGHYVARCGSASCSTITSHRINMSVDASAEQPAITIDAAGLPVVVLPSSSYEATELRVVHCANRFCVPHVRY